MTTPEKIFDVILPTLISCGSYALAIQQKVERQGNKEQYSGNIFGEVLTDADLSVQNAVEVALLSAFDDIAFYGEEEDSSLNAKYFPFEAPYSVMLDPIDGTLLFKDGYPNFNIILSVVSESSYELVIVCMPGLRRTFVAFKGEEAFYVSHDALNERHKLVLNPEAGIVVHGPELSLKSNHLLRSYEFVRDYGSVTPPLSPNSLLLGDASAIAHMRGQAIDSLAIAFVAQQAGALVGDVEGEPLNTAGLFRKRTLPSVIAGANREVYETLIANLGRVSQ